MFLINSVIVHFKGNSQRHISNTVSVKKQKLTVNKGKNIHLFMEGDLPDLLHEFEPIIINNSQNCFKPLLSSEKTPARTDFDKCIMEDTIGNNVVSSALSSDIYSLDMNTTFKSDCLYLARGAIGNIIHMAQNKQFFGFISIYGFQVHINDTHTNCMCRYVVSA